MRKRIVFADEGGLVDAVRLVEALAGGREVVSGSEGQAEQVQAVSSSDGLEVKFDVELHGVGRLSNGGDVGGRYPFSKVWDLEDEDSRVMLADYLRAQPIGTKVSLFVSRPHWKVLTEIGSSVGLSAEEIEGTPYGPMMEQVFCIGCYQYNPPTCAERITCRHCGRVLSVSTHYSKRLDAVFGYLTIAQVSEVLADD